MAARNYSDNDTYESATAALRGALAINVVLDGSDNGLEPFVLNDLRTASSALILRAQSELHKLRTLTSAANILTQVGQAAYAATRPSASNKPDPGEA